MTDNTYDTVEDPEQAAVGILKQLEEEWMVPIPASLWEEIQTGRLSAQEVLGALMDMDMRRRLRYGFPCHPLWLA